MNNNIKGCFYFIKTINGNLIGEFINNKIDKHIVESANLADSENNNNFKGIYTTIWLQGKVAHKAKLVITEKENTYLLEWFEMNIKGDKMFEGIAKIENGILKGQYND
jgi:hypothetical protein